MKQLGAIGQKYIMEIKEFMGAMSAPAFGF